MREHKRYQYDIFKPGSTTDTFLHIHEDTPLMDFAVGDLIHGEFILNYSKEKVPALRVVSRKHVLWNSDEGTLHQILIYTEDAGISELHI